jgi:hypothetical protein
LHLHGRWLILKLLLRQPKKIKAPSGQNSPSMRVLAQSVDVLKVTACLSTGWEFLSGERRAFEHVPDAPPPGYAEFCYFMPLSVPGAATAGGVGVFIERSDARTIAANMFGEPPHEIHASKLNDACAEACNVLAECVTLNITSQANVSIGLPFRADDLVFQQVFTTCVPVAIYRCNLRAGQLFVIAYEIPNPS